MNARKTLTLLAAAVVLCLPAVSFAAVDVFLKLDGIDGESTDDQHRHEIVIEAWSFGATQTLSAASGGRATGKACLSDISMVKYVDKASPLLLGAAMLGQHIPTAVMKVRKAGKDQQDYLIVTMKDVLVSSVSQSGSGELPMESLSLNFGSLTLTYKPRKEDGSFDKDVVTTVSGRC